ncbi:tRNA (5-methylaminomethyl-2-thiouridine)(34)-methyltransferase MnmD [Candidimonas nitroreducens]|uniref:tRNA 5-methylaminomethyl-2-thiouridine biosynthesis bifunctional protein MnmC n=1 Tax=Candidimonas nitroreducens TaxID=683354 RepID=A0A225MG94_9BURK|nr:tRNA (5-methylaminomethyl-2-thiouridine)(34)-methyltransferase MnmD [Candidimonas nitroreducens]OWT60347.1 hypothetical protein CEY11_11940 [Candidimonas nitroreducens]
MSFEPLVPAVLAYDEAGTPVSERYGDVYHAEMGALAQAEHVFLRGNRLPQRWRGLEAFTVCETGFGLGQNFLALWRAWHEDARRPARLHVVSFEAHPFTRADLERALLPRLPASVRALARQLIGAWPPLLPGLHRLEFEGGAVTLTLAFGKIEKLARQIEARVDAYFLDGFAPSKNPEMWTPRLFGQMVRMANPGATAASWCCAGSVRRDLAAAGFLLAREPGFGRKREMMTASLRPTLCLDRPPLWRGVPVLVVGGGLAGAGMAQALALRGHEVTVCDPAFAAGPGASHRGHVAAALTPLISRDDDPRARLSRAGAARALQRWQGLPQEARPLRCGTFEPCADAAHAETRRSSLARLDFPRDWVEWLDAPEASRRSGVALPRGGVFFHDGQLLRPPLLIEALLGHAAVRRLPVAVSRLEPMPGGGWLARDQAGRELARAPVAVLANAMGVPALLGHLPEAQPLLRPRAMHAVAGQLDYYALPAGLAPRVILAGNGYCLPAVEGINVAGSTYVPNATSCATSAEGSREIRDKLGALLHVPGEELAGLRHPAAAWGGWRAVAAGRMPLIGPVAALPGLWLACAYGSRGLTWSALAGDVVAASLDGEPVPVERELLRAVAVC